MSKKRRALSILLAALTASLLLFASSPSSFSSTNPNLCAIARRTVEYYFATEHLHSGSLSKLIHELEAESRTVSPQGVFVTLSRSGKSRACWGTLTPEHKDLLSQTVFSTVGALTKDYRYPPVRIDELKDLKVQVTVIKSVEPIRGISAQNPLRDGLLVRAGGKSGLLLPGEASDAYYQLVQCKLKAGIKPGEPCQLYRIIADVCQ